MPVLSGDSKRDKMAQQSSPVTLLRLKQLSARLSISKSSIYDRLNPSSLRYDETFPKPIKLGRATAFLNHEVEAFIESKLSLRR
jgi:prophage regulatory protein